MRNIWACDFDSGLIKKYDVFYKNIQNVTTQEHTITYSDMCNVKKISAK